MTTFMEMFDQLCCFLKIFKSVLLGLPFHFFGIFILKDLLHLINLFNFLFSLLSFILTIHFPFFKILLFFKFRSLIRLYENFSFIIFMYSICSYYHQLSLSIFEKELLEFELHLKIDQFKFLLLNFDVKNLKAKVINFIKKFRKYQIQNNHFYQSFVVPVLKLFFHYFVLCTKASFHCPHRLR